MIDASEIRLLDLLVETLPSGLLLFEADGGILRMNAKARELLALPADASPGHFMELPEYLEPLIELLSSADGDITRGEVALQLPSRDEPSTLGFNLKRMQKREGGEPTRALTFSDITQVLKDRLAMDSIKDELSQSRKLASIGTMIAGVAHELNNPLTGISMSTSLIKLNLERLQQQPVTKENQKLADSLTQALAEVGKVAASTERAAVLVGDLLSYSKPVQLDFQPISLPDMLADIMAALRSHPQFSQFTFKQAPVTVPPAHHIVLCDRVKMEQVFYNLFKNACDATEGKGELTVSFSEAALQGQPAIVAHVVDNGPGIDTATIKRIFDPFFTTKGHGGVGLGLSVSYRTVEQHGGHLSVSSEPGEGTEFQVTLPIIQDQAMGDLH